MPTAKIITPVLPGRYYHIYNRGVNSRKTFLSDYDYYLFLIKYMQYVSEYADTLAYCLLPNHYHFLLRIKPGMVADHLRFGRQWGKLIVSYTFAFQKMHNYSGNLFPRCFRRLEITTEEYLRYLVYYIHSNPAKHGVDMDFTNYPFSSFSKFNSADNGIVNYQDTLLLFGSMKDFFDYHQTLHRIVKNRRIQLEDPSKEVVLA